MLKLCLCFSLRGLTLIRRIKRISHRKTKLFSKYSFSMPKIHNLGSFFWYSFPFQILKLLRAACEVYKIFKASGIHGVVDAYPLCAEYITYISAKKAHFKKQSPTSLTTPTKWKKNDDDDNTRSQKFPKSRVCKAAHTFSPS